MSQNNNDSNAPNQTDRRTFVKKVVAGGAIAVPVIATFSLGTILGDAQAVSSSGSGSEWSDGTAHSGMEGGPGSFSSSSATSETPAPPPSPISSSAYSGSSQSGASCLADPGYDGPGRFAAHLVYAGAPGNLAARINGEIVLVVDTERHDRDHDHDRGHDRDGRGRQAQRIHTEMHITGLNNGGVVFDSASLMINGNFAAAIASGRGSIDGSDVNASFCDLDYVLNAMASGQATVLVLAHYLGQPINLAGPVAAAGPGFDFVTLRS